MRVKDLTPSSIRGTDRDARGATHHWGARGAPWQFRGTPWRVSQATWTTHLIRTIWIITSLPKISSSTPPSRFLLILQIIVHSLTLTFMILTLTLILIMFAYRMMLRREGN